MVRLDTDRYYRPTGTGVVQFRDKISYTKAVSAGYIVVSTAYPPFLRKVIIYQYHIRH